MPTDTVEEEKSPASFVCAVDWNAGVDDGPGPKPLTDRFDTSLALVEHYYYHCYYLCSLVQICASVLFFDFSQ